MNVSNEIPFLEENVYFCETIHIESAIVKIEDKFLIFITLLLTLPILLTPKINITVLSAVKRRRKKINVKRNILQLNMHKNN